MAKGKSDRLPGMESPAIEELEQKAAAYVKIRDKRIALSRSEHDMNQELLAIMKKRKLETYNHDGVKCTIVIEKEKVKVKVSEPE